MLLIPLDGGKLLNKGTSRKENSPRSPVRFREKRRRTKKKIPTAHKRHLSSGRVTEIPKKKRGEKKK